MDEARLIALSSYSNEQIESLRSGQQRLREEEVAAQTAFRLTTGQLEEHQSKKPEMEEEETLESLEVLSLLWMKRSQQAIRPSYD